MLRLFRCYILVLFLMVFVTCAHCEQLLNSLLAKQTSDLGFFIALDHEVYYYHVTSDFVRARFGDGVLWAQDFGLGLDLMEPSIRKVSRKSARQIEIFEYQSRYLARKRQQ